jgi:hypothetical protein
MRRGAVEGDSTSAFYQPRPADATASAAWVPLSILAGAGGGVKFTRPLKNFAKRLDSP